MSTINTIPNTAITIKIFFNSVVLDQISKFFMLLTNCLNEQLLYIN